MANTLLTEKLSWLKGGITSLLGNNPFGSEFIENKGYTFTLV